MKTLYPYFSLLLLALILFSSCENRPAEVLSASEMAEIMADLNKAEAVFELERFQGKVDPEDQYRYRLGILEKHKTNKAQLDSSIVWYNRDPKKLDKVFHRAVQMLQEEKKYIEENPITRKGSLVLGKENRDFIWYRSFLDQLSAPDKYSFTPDKYSIQTWTDSLLLKYNLLPPPSSKAKRRYAKELRTWSMGDISEYYLSRGRNCDYDKIPLPQWCEGIFRLYDEEPLVLEGRSDSIMIKEAVKALPSDSVRNNVLKKN